MDPQGERNASITFVVFDMDGVLAHLDREKRLRYLADVTGKPPGHFDATVWCSDFEPGAEAGDYPEAADYLAEFNRRSGCSLDRGQWVEARRQAMTLIPETLDIAREVRREARIAVLTNNGSLLKESLPVLIPEAWRLFGEAMHVSCEFRARKPDPLVFERLLDRHGARAAEALLIDDDPKNVRGAREAGMNAVLFRNPSTLRRDLFRFGLLKGSHGTLGE